MHQAKPREDHSQEAEALKQACQREGCPLCTVVLERVAAAMETWSYEGFTDREQRALLTRIRGFCSLHTWQLAQRNSAFQLAVVYENILSEMEHDLAREQTNSSQESSDRNWLLEIKHLLQPGGSVDTRNSQGTLNSVLSARYALVPSSA